MRAWILIKLVTAGVSGIQDEDELYQPSALLDEAKSLGSGRGGWQRIAEGQRTSAASASLASSRDRLTGEPASLDHGRSNSARLRPEHVCGFQAALRQLPTDVAGLSPRRIGSKFRRPGPNSAYCPAMIFGVMMPM